MNQEEHHKVPIKTPLGAVRLTKSRLSSDRVVSHSCGRVSLCSLLRFYK